LQGSRLAFVCENVEGEDGAGNIRLFLVLFHSYWFGSNFGENPVLERMVVTESRRHYH